jgi:hypothetical protein
MSNTTYLVSARKYRPLLFKDVVAQEHVTETLKNAIRLERLAHAYMFTGLVALERLRQLALLRKLSTARPHQTNAKTRLNHAGSVCHVCPSKKDGT